METEETKWRGWGRHEVHEDYTFEHKGRQEDTGRGVATLS